MTPQLIVELLKQGLLGVLLVIAMYVIGKLYMMREADRVAATTELKAAHAERLAADATHHAELVELMRTSVTAISNQANTSNAVKESLTEVNEALAENNKTLTEYLNEQRRSLRR